MLQSKMKNRIIALVVGMVLLLFSYLHAQITFERWYGGNDYDYCNSVVQTSDGGYILAGTTYSFGAGGCDVYLMKTDSLGDTLWTRTYGGSSYDWAQSVKQTSDEGYIIVGRTISFGEGQDDVYLIRTDTNGDNIWTKTYGATDDDRGESVDQTTDGGYIITGMTESYSNGQRDLFLIKTDANGDTVWTKKWPSIGFYADCGYSVIQTSDGGYMAAGYTYSYGAGGGNVYIVKTNTLGDTLWTRTYGGSMKDWALSVAQTTDGGYIVAGGTESYGAYSGDVYLLKTYSNGDTVWTKNYGGSDTDAGYSLELSTDNRYIIVGKTLSLGAPWDDVFLIGTDSLGDTLWTRTYGGTDYDCGFSVQKTYDSNYIITGYTKSFGSGLADVYLIKVNENGDTIWTNAYGWPEADIGYCVQQTTDSGYIITGYTKSFGTGDWDVLLVKTQSDVGIEEKDTRNITYNPKFRIYPNPFSKSSTISYQLPMKGNVTLRVYDLSGRLVRLLLSGEQNSGYYEVTWDGSNGNGIKVPRGIYFVRLEIGEYTETKKIIKIR